MSGKVQLRDIAGRLGVSVKTVSGALSGDTVRMSADMRQRIRDLANELGYQPNIVARGMRQGVLPVIGLVADGLITLPFATEIVRSLDNVARAYGLSVMATNVGTSRSIESAIEEVQRFLPRSLVFATMYHRMLTLSENARKSIKLTINCFDSSGSVPAIVPDEFQAAHDIAAHCLDKGRRRIAFLNLPGLLAGRLREDGFRAAHESRGTGVEQAWILSATRGERYSEFSVSLVPQHIDRLLAGRQRPDAILCGNDRVALEVYGALRRRNVSIPDDIAVASFDNQAEIARRLDPPLTTMALPLREMGRRAAEIVAGMSPVTEITERIPFRLVQRSSV